jgi:Na+/H+-dicarboxylate symporter
MAETAATDGAGHDEMRARRLRWRMLVGFLAGLIIGLAVHYGARDAAWVETVITYVTGPLGQIFLRLLFMLVTRCSSRR